MTHLRPDDLIDAVEGTLSAARRAHLEACDGCRREVAALTQVLAGTRETEVPEPSPLYWTHFSNRVRDAIAQEVAATPRPNATGWFRWPVLVPFAALALLVIALINVIPRSDALPGRDTTVAVDAAPDATDPALAADEAWDALADLGGTLDADTAEEAGSATMPGAADRAVLTLTDAEQQELLRLLEQELKGSGG